MQSENSKTKRHHSGRICRLVWSVGAGGVCLWAVVSLCYLANVLRQNRPKILHPRHPLFHLRRLPGQKLLSEKIHLLQSQLLRVKGNDSISAPFGVDSKLHIRILLSRHGVEYMDPSPTRLHGSLGLEDDGTPGWYAQPPPPPNQDVQSALRNGGGFNIELSDSIPLDRQIADPRSKFCRSKTFDAVELPKTSVVIAFHNEHFSTLMRTVHSVLNHSPPQLLQEIILVDDGSREIERLDEYVRLLPKVRLMRLSSRKGIVTARLQGIRSVSSSIFVVLDSHVEVNVGWLQPLVARVSENRIRIVMPQVDGTNPETLNAHEPGIGCTLGFLWRMSEHAIHTSNPFMSEERRRAIESEDYSTSPTMAGGLFAADRDFFLEIGGYDEWFVDWGTENLELSFRLWMCGGVLECAPCSRVSHIFRRGGRDYMNGPESLLKNKMRTLSTWMDGYGDLAWRMLDEPVVDFGSIDERKRWRQSHQCKSFSWYLSNVYPESHIQTLDDVPYFGTLRNSGSNLCLDNGNQRDVHSPLLLYGCHGGMTQKFMYLRRSRRIVVVMNEEVCVGEKTETAITERCSSSISWIVRADRLVESDQTGLCLAVLSSEHNQLDLVTCNAEDSLQVWDWTPYRPAEDFTPPPPPNPKLIEA